jgi:hypothetical protein
MQLRSGKIIQTMSTNSNGVQYKKQDRKTIVVKHSMTLRSAKSQELLYQPQSQVQQTTSPHTVIHFQSTIKTQTQTTVYRDWLISRLKGFAADFHQYDNLEYKQRVLEKTQLFVEMVAVLRENIDYIVSSPVFCNFTQTLYIKLLEFKNEITALLNGEEIDSESYVPCDFSDAERTFLGNARVDIVKLLTIVKPCVSAV